MTHNRSETNTTITLSKTIEGIIDNYNDLIGSEADAQKRELSIDSAKDLQKALDTLENENRSLKIGIVGRVKAGKSSLLNALVFDGKSILPKAATPMTAALTQISYGKSLAVEVDFFSQEDIAAIKSSHDRYKQQWQQQVTSNLEKLKERRKKNRRSPKATDDELLIKAERQAHRNLKSNIRLSSSYDQYLRMQQSGVDVTTLDEKTIIQANNMDDLNTKLLDHVGAEGKYMPFTKTVHIKLPQDNLKEIEIVDTPGINDPVQSREDRTQELLKYCDVIFIVSPSGQFLSSEDMDLMDRITTKEGVRELIVVASQVDTQLMGSVKAENNGQLSGALKSITSTLGEHLKNTLQQLKSTNKEIGTTFDELINQSIDKTIYSSGICESMRTTFDNKDTWDDGAKKVWENLTREYPDYFSDNDQTLSLSNLELLSNIKTIQKILDSVKEKKEQIKEQKKTELLSQKRRALENYKGKLIIEANSQRNQLENADAKLLEEEKNKLQTVFNRSSEDLADIYDDLLKTYKIDSRQTLSNELRSFYKEAKGEIQDSQSTETKTKKVKVDKQGAGNWFARKLWGGGQEEITKHIEITTVRSGAVSQGITEFITEIEDVISDKAMSNSLTFKRTLNRELVGTLRKHIEDDELDAQIIQKSIREVINKVVYPEFEYDTKLPSHLSARGTLKKSDAEQFMSEAMNFISDFNTTVKQNISLYTDDLILALESHDPAKGFFDSYNSKIEKLEKELENKAITIEKYKRLISSLEEA